MGANLMCWLAGLHKDIRGRALKKQEREAKKQ